MRDAPEKFWTWVIVEPLECRTLLSGGIRGFVIDQSAGNIPISGITIYIDADSDNKLDSGELRVVTDAAGVFQFTNIPAGFYLVRQVLPAEYELVEYANPEYLGTHVDDGFEANGGKFINAHYWLVVGTADGDIITAQANPGGAKVTLNGVADVRALDAYKGIMFRGRAGNDRITVDGQLSIFTKISGDDGNDTLVGGSGVDSISGGRGDDKINGGGGNDNITGGARNDRLLGGTGDDSISGGQGSDVLLGGTGDDLLSTADWAYGDSVSGGGGTDTLNRDSKDHWNSVENVKRVRRPSGGSGFGCFLTTAVVRWAGKSDDCHELTTLRRFRDAYMRGLSEGEAMIKDYYVYAPRVVEAIEAQKQGDKEWPRIYASVQQAVALVEAGRNAEALELYAAEYLRLKAEYL